ncbi:DUF1177 domain-containing protein [Lysinibacillus agricola]|uniref:DUF1177 domain-containing protein n=1 Tax=Lysinibacillus agricola TaxID=2590012 RepID=A0ABX7AY75_9BACI|nr:DUF1177 domain-containing protein [Lysinibacillus agricola]QQP14680.1 DUF1177 domain-containing protein [Lysinibacillus agricola]
MALKQTLTILDVLDHPKVNGEKVIQLFERYDGVEAFYQTVQGEQGATDFVKIVIPGTEGKLNHGHAPSLGIIGQLGGIGARPERSGFVSDGDGAVAPIAVALKLAEMKDRGDVLAGDVYITTHICPSAPTEPYESVEFMSSPVDVFTMNQYEVLEEMDAIISIDTTKGNKVMNHRGIAISPTVKRGYVLKFADDLIRIKEMTTGELPVTIAVTTLDMTPYGNHVYHINSILQSAVATSAPVVGLAITTKSVVPSSGTGANHEIDIAQAARFSIEVAKEFGRGTAKFYNENEFKRLNKLYGSMTHLQTLGVTTNE